MRIEEGRRSRARGIMEGYHVPSIVLGFGDTGDQNRLFAIKELSFVMECHIIIRTMYSSGKHRGL